MRGILSCVALSAVLTASAFATEPSRPTDTPKFQTLTRVCNMQAAATPLCMQVLVDKNTQCVWILAIRDHEEYFDSPVQYTFQKRVDLPCDPPRATTIPRFEALGDPVLQKGIPSAIWQQGLIDNRTGNIFVARLSEDKSAIITTPVPYLLRNRGTIVIKPR